MRRCPTDGVCASMKGKKVAGRNEKHCPARNESTAPPVALVGKQSPYKPGEM